MKEERLAILSMLEKGLITVDEAERLLTVLQNGMGLEKDGIGKAVAMHWKKREIYWAMWQKPWEKSRTITTKSKRSCNKSC